MPKLSAKLVRDFTVPVSDPRPSPHGSQREDAILALYLPGWSREASAAAKAEFLPGVPPVAEGNGRGRGATFVDGFRVNPSRSCGGDFLSLKAPCARDEGAPFTTAHELFTGTLDTLTAGLAAMRAHARNRKRFPLAVVHTDGGTFSPRILEWTVVDLPALLSNIPNPAGWATVAGVPVRPQGFRSGRGGNPCPVWVHQNPKTGYWTLSTSLRGVAFQTGTTAEFAASVDAATR